MGRRCEFHAGRMSMTDGAESRQEGIESSEVTDWLARDIDQMFLRRPPKRLVYTTLFEHIYILMLMLSLLMFTTLKSVWVASEWEQWTLPTPSICSLRLVFDQPQLFFPSEMIAVIFPVHLPSA